MEHNNIIELNGKRYDALTGKYLGKSQTPIVPATVSHGSTRTVDGFIKRPTLAGGHRTQTLNARPAEPVSTPQQSKSAHRQPPKHAMPHKPQHTKTLMRHAVNPPTAAEAKKNHGIAKSDSHTPELKKSVTNVDGLRLRRSQNVQRHREIQRFKTGNPKHPSNETQTITHVNKPAKYRTSAARASVAPQRAFEHPARHQDIFENAVARANSHQQPAPRHTKKTSRKTKLARITASATIIIALSGFTLWTQRPNIELRLASWQAGFSASMPKYTLEGYQRTFTRQEHGQIIIAYRSGDRHYRITQQSSGWNSQTLKEQEVAGTGTKNLQTIESKGRLVYLYDSNASWVDGGVRYDITGDAPLTADDIAAIIDSM